MRQFKTANRNQLLVLPPNLNDWLRANHPARFVVAFVEGLDLSEFYKVYETGGRGQPPYDPALMLGILLYANMLGVTSSRKIERLTQDDIGFRFITGNRCPDHDTIADFRKTHHASLKVAFEGAIQLAVKAGAVRLGHVAIDGTKMRANAAKGKRQSKEQLQQQSKQIKQWVGNFLDECEETDAREDEEFGEENPYFLPNHLSNEEALKQWIADSLKELSAEKEREAEAKSDKPLTARERKLRKKLEKLKKAEAAIDEQTKSEEQADPTGRQKRERERKRGGEKETPKVNVTDPDCRRMRFYDGTFQEAYNCQIAVDDELGIIVAADLVQDRNDQRQLLPMVLQVQDNTKWLPDHVSADTGYFTVTQIEDPRLRSVDFFIPPRKRSAQEGDDTKSERMREKLETELGRSLFNARKSIVEPVFGAIKHARNVKRLVLRGKEMVKAEWLLWCTGHNLLKLFTAGVSVA